MSGGGAGDAEALARAESAWNAAVEITPASAGSVQKALIFGVNVRVKFPEAFLAAYEAVEAGEAIAVASATHVSWPIAVWKTYCAARSVFSALIERIGALSYVTAAVLSQHKGEIEEADLKAEVDAFLDNPDTRKFGWHLGLTDGMVENASNDRDDDNWFDDAIKELDKGKFLARNGSKVAFLPKHVEWSMAI